MKSTIAETIAGQLFQGGVRFVFGQPGGEVVDLIEALENRAVRFVLMGHESAAAFAAAAVGQATGVPGVCLSTLGPGACNLTLGIGDAYLDRHPMLAISARTAAHQEAWFNHQNLRLNELFAPISKASIPLDGSATATTIQDALALASHSPRGPVYLSLPADIAVQPDNASATPDNASGAPVNSFSEPLPPLDSDAVLSRIELALNGAERPVVVVGISLDQQRDMGPIRAFLAATGLPYADTPKTKGLVDHRGAGYLGTCLSASGDAIINDLIRQSDCILGLGYDPVETTYDWHLSDHYHAIVDGPTSFGLFQPSFEAIGDVGAMVRRLAARYDGRPIWNPEIFAAVRRQVESAIRPEIEAGEAGLSPFTVANTLRTELPASTRLAVDTGQHKMLFCQAWRTEKPLTFFCSNGLSSMGFAVPTAIALTLLDPQHPAVSVAGDGGFAMMVQELESVNRLGISPLFVVLCDQALSLISLPQQMRNLPRRAIDLAPVDWAKVAEGFGVRGQWARTSDELRQAISNWRKAPTATVLAVQIDDALYRGNKY